MKSESNSPQVPFQGQVSQLVAYAYERAPYFRRLLDQENIYPASLRAPADLEQIPVTHKDNLIALQQETPPLGGWLDDERCKSLARLFLSPGPIVDPQGPVEDYWHFARALRIAGFKPGDIVQNTFSYHLSPGGFMLDAGLRAVGCTVFPAGVGNTELQVEAASRLRISGYVGTPSFLLKLLEKGQQEKKKLYYRVALVTGEPLPPSLRNLFLEKYKVQVFQVYATADLGCVGYECSQQNGWHVNPEFLVSICDPVTGKSLPTGRTGEIVVTHFNPHYPLIRFGTGDLSRWISEPCPCGDPAPRLDGFQGRIGEGVKVKGMFVHPRQVKETLEQFSGIVDFQLVITRTAQQEDHLTYRLVPAEQELATYKFAKELEEALQEVVKVRGVVEWVENLEGPEHKVLDLRKWE